MTSSATPTAPSCAASAGTDPPPEPCPFCRIVSGGKPRPRRLERRGYGRGAGEVTGVVLFEPLNPVTPGHTLIVPFKHVRDATAAPYITAGVMHYAALYGKETGEEGHLIANCGSAAGQTVFHLHVHWVPRRPGDALLMPWDHTGACRCL